MSLLAATLLAPRVASGACIAWQNARKERGCHSIRNNGLTDLTFIVVTTPLEDR
jgi:hypothetical protein